MPCEFHPWHQTAHINCRYKYVSSYEDLCILQRVNAEKIQRISKHIKTVANKLENFIRTMTFHMRSTLRRTHDALLKIKQLVRDDVAMMKDMVNNFKETYDLYFGQKIDHLLYFLDSAESYQDYLLLRMKSGPWKNSLYTKTSKKMGVKDYGWNTFIQAMGVFDVLVLSLTSVKDIEIMVPITTLNDSARKALPSNLWRSNERWQACEEFLHALHSHINKQCYCFTKHCPIGWNKKKNEWGGLASYGRECQPGKISWVPSESVQTNTEIPC